MPNPQAMTESEELEARDKAFYLVKKYTSYTFLDRARRAYQEFLDAFEWQLSDPECVQFSVPEEYGQYIMQHGAAHEGQYSSLLDKMARLEEGLKLLRSSTDKNRAYCAVLMGTFEGLLWGRGASEWGLYDDPFYQALGTYNPPDAAATNEPLDVHFASKALDVLLRTLFGWDARWMQHPSTDCLWTYRTVFDGDKGSGRDIPIASYPQALPPCPAKNLSTKGQIWSGEEIPITGIWEPWFVEESLWEGIVNRLAGKRASRFAGKVGCPNYLLAGTTAFEYRTERTSQEQRVAWRLLWEDTRYLDGRIPDEENAYFSATETTQSDVRTARTGEPCPESGEWYSRNWERKRVTIEKGELMPGSEISSTDPVTWHLRKKRRDV